MCSLRYFSQIYDHLDKWWFLKSSKLVSQPGSDLDDTSMEWHVLKYRNISFLLNNMKIISFWRNIYQKTILMLTNKTWLIPRIYCIWLNSINLFNGFFNNFHHSMKYIFYGELVPKLFLFLLISLYRRWMIVHCLI